MAVEAMAAGVHDEGKRVYVTADAHERQETDAAFHQHFLFILVRDTDVGLIRAFIFM